LKKMWTHLAGNPHLSDEEITKRSWGDTFSDNSFNHVRNADYSMKSFQDANQSIQNNMKVIQAVGPQALANVSPVSGLVTGESPGWNTGAAQQAADIMKQGQRGQ
ncbi:hypothetical protein ACFWFJ_27035, partial [Nocardia salmonicida]